ncbi:MAG TPA: DUF1579 family protein, partial [Daejeonella sp.]|nr:DUF1579 family protein [Daejeonella sp.]
MKQLLLSITLLFSTIAMQAQETDPWTKYMTPLSTHKFLSRYTGNFEMEIKMWMNEGKEPMIVKVNSKHDTILGGRFLEMKQAGNMMGMDYQSIMTLGFNNTDEKFAMTTLTNMGTGILSLHGNWDVENKVANLTGQMTNPVSKNKINVRQKITFLDDNTILIENYDQEGNSQEKKSI